MLRKIVKFALLTLIILSCLFVLLFCVLPYVLETAQNPDPNPGALISLMAVTLLSIPILVTEIELAFNVLYFWSPKERKCLWKTVYHLVAAAAALAMWIFFLVFPTNFIPVHIVLVVFLIIWHLTYWTLLAVEQKPARSPLLNLEECT